MCIKYHIKSFFEVTIIYAGRLFLIELIGFCLMAGRLMYKHVTCISDSYDQTWFYTKGTCSMKSLRSMK